MKPLLTAIAIVLMAATVVAGASTDGNYTLLQTDIVGSGQTGTDGNYVMFIDIGEPIVSHNASDENYAVSLGFFEQAFSTITQFVEPYVPPGGGGTNPTIDFNFIVETEWNEEKGLAIIVKADKPLADIKIILTVADKFYPIIYGFSEFNELDANTWIVYISKEDLKNASYFIVEAQYRGRVKQFKMSVQDAIEGKITELPLNVFDMMLVFFVAKDYVVYSFFLAGNLIEITRNMTIFGVIMAIILLAFVYKYVKKKKYTKVYR